MPHTTIIRHLTMQEQQVVYDRLVNAERAGLIKFQWNNEQRQFVITWNETP